MLAPQSNKSSPQNEKRQSIRRKNNKNPQKSFRQLKSKIVSFKDSLSNQINDQSSSRILQDISTIQSCRPSFPNSENSGNSIAIEQNSKRQSIQSHSSRKGNSLSRESVSSVTNNRFIRTNQMEEKRLNTNQSTQMSNSSEKFQHQGQTTNCVQKQAVPEKLMILQDKLRQTEEKLKKQHDLYLGKCLQVQKNKEFIEQLEKQKQALGKDLQKSNQNNQYNKKNSSNLSKLLNDARLANIKLEGEVKILQCKLDDENSKNIKLSQKTQQLENEMQNLKQVKQGMLQLQQTDEDNKKQIQNHIAYELKLTDLQAEIKKQLTLTMEDLKQAKNIRLSTNKDIENVEKQIGIRFKQVMVQKNALAKQLQEARDQTQKIRKNMFTGYQQQISELKNQRITLKEQNVILKSNSESMIKIAKLEREVKILKSKNQQLLKRNKQNEQIVDKINSQNIVGRKNIEQTQTQVSNRSIEYYDGDCHADLSSIIKGYESRSTDLNTRIHEKQACEQALKDKLQALEQQCLELKESLKVKKRAEKSIIANSQNQVDTITLQLKNERQSAGHKLQSLQANIKRKNKQLKEKDDFITQYLLKKLKNQQQVQQIITSIGQHFTTIQ